MTLLRTFGTYRSLKPAQRQFIKSPQISETHTLVEWLLFLRRLGVLDQYGDHARADANRAIVACIVITFLGIFIPTIADLKGLPQLIGFNLAGTCAVVLLLAISIRVALGRVDIPNTMRTFVLPFLTLLRADTGNRAPLTLSLDLRGCTDESKIVRREEPEARTTYTFYVDPWLAGSIRLVDGSILRFRITDHVRERRRSRTNARGKTKTKTKYKIKRRIDLQLGLRNEVYNVKSPDGGAVRAERDDPKRTVLRTRRDEEFLVTYDDWDAFYKADLVGQVSESISKLYKHARLKAGA